MNDHVQRAIALLKALEKEQGDANSSLAEPLRKAIAELEAISAESSVSGQSGPDSKKVLESLDAAFLGMKVIKALLELLKFGDG